MELVLLLGREKWDEIEGRWREKTEREEPSVLDYLNADIDFCICQWVNYGRTNGTRSPLSSLAWSPFLPPIYTCTLEFLQLTVTVHYITKWL
jgi:hypothetical protein